MSGETKPRRRIWEVQPINVRVDEEIEKAVKTPEDTDINTELKRIKLDRVRKMVEDARTLEVEEVLEERRMNIEDLRAKRKEIVERRKRQGGEDLVAPVEPQAPPKMSGEELSKLVEVSKLPPEQREEFYRAVAYTRGMYGGAGANADSVIPMLMMFSKQNQNIGFPEMISFTQTILGAAKQMREETKESGGKDVDINEIVKTIYAEKNKEQDSFAKFLAQIEQVEKIRNLIAPPQNPANISSSVEMAKVEKGHELELAKLAQNKVLEEKRITVEEKKADALGAGLTRLAATAGAALAAGESEGEGGGVEHRPRKRPESSIMEFACSECGATIVAPNPKVGDQVTCGKCGWMHEVTKETGGEPKKDGQGK